MSRLKLFLTVLALALLGLLASSANAATCGTGYGTCNCSDTLNTTYTLTAADSVTNGTACNGNGLNISEANIHLDCNRRNLAGNGSGTGLANDAGLDNFTISNCIVYNFSTGLYLYGYGAHAYNNIVNNSNETGIFMPSATHTVIEDNVVVDSRVRGVHLSNGATNNTIRNNSLYNNTWEAPPMPYQSCFSNGYWYPNPGAGPRTAYDNRLYYFYGSNGLLEVPNVPITDISITGYNGTQDLARVFFINNSNNLNITVYFNNSAVTSCTDFNIWMFDNYSSIFNDITCVFYEVNGASATGYGKGYWVDVSLERTDNVCIYPSNTYGAITVTQGSHNNTVFNNTVIASGKYGIYLGQSSWPSNNNNVSYNNVSYSDLTGIQAENGDSLYIDNNYVFNTTELSSSCIGGGAIWNSFIRFNNASQCYTGGIWFCGGSSNVKVLNNTVTDSGWAAIAAGCGTTNSEYAYNNLTENRGDGFALAFSLKNSEIHDNLICNNSQVGVQIVANGFDTIFSEGNHIYNNEICNNSDGFAADRDPWAPGLGDLSHDNKVYLNYIHDNRGSGVQITYYHYDDEIYDNWIYNNWNDGVKFTNTNSSNQIYGNAIYRNGENGININNATNLNDGGPIHNNYVFNNPYGIHVTDSNGVLSYGNGVFNNRILGVLVTNSQQVTVADALHEYNPTSVFVQNSSNIQITGLGGQTPHVLYFASYSPLSYGGRNFSDLVGFMSESDGAQVPYDYFPVSEMGFNGTQNVTVVLLNVTNVTEGMFDENITLYFDSQAVQGMDCPYLEAHCSAMFEFDCGCWFNDTAFEAKGYGNDYSWLLTNPGDPTPLVDAGTLTTPNRNTRDGVYETPFITAGMKIRNNGEAPGSYYLVSYAPLSLGGRDFDDYSLYVSDPGGSTTDILGDYTDLAPAGVDGTVDVNVALINYTNLGQGMEDFNMSVYYNASLGWDCPIIEAGVCPNIGGGGGSCACFYNGTAFHQNGAGNDYSWLLTNPGDPTIVTGYTDPAFLHAQTGGIAVFMANSSDSGLLWLNVSSTGGDGISLERSYNTTVNFSRVTNSSANSLHLRNSYDNFFADNILQAASYDGFYDVVSKENSTDNTFLNTTFNKTAVAFDSAYDNFTVQWYVDIQVLNYSHYPLAGSPVTGYDNFSSTVFTATTAGAEGRTGPQPSTEYTQNGSQTYGVNQTTFMTYAFFAQPPAGTDYGSNYTAGYNFTQSVLYQIFLPTTAPDLVISLLVPNPNKRIFITAENVSFEITVFNAAADNTTANVTVNVSNSGASFNCTPIFMLPFTTETIKCGYAMVNGSSVNVTAYVAPIPQEGNFANNQKTLILEVQNTNVKLSLPDTNLFLAVLTALAAALFLSRKRAPRK